MRKGAATLIEYSLPGKLGRCLPRYLDRNALEFDNASQSWIERQPDGFVLCYGCEFSSSSSSGGSDGNGSEGSGSGSGNGSGSGSGGEKSIEYVLCFPPPSGSSSSSNSGSGSSSNSSCGSSSCGDGSSSGGCDSFPEMEFGYVRNILPVDHSVPFPGVPLNVDGAQGRAGQAMLCTIDQEVCCGQAQPNHATYDLGPMPSATWSMDGRPVGIDRAIGMARDYTTGYRLRRIEMGNDCGVGMYTASVNVHNGNLVLSYSLPGGGPAESPNLNTTTMPS